MRQELMENHFYLGKTAIPISRNTPPQSIQIKGQLRNVSSWTFPISYFPKFEGLEETIIEFSFNTFEDGDYHDMQGKLWEIEKSEATFACFIEHQDGGNFRDVKE